jgi:hypothetical protein
MKKQVLIVGMVLLMCAKLYGLSEAQMNKICGDYEKGFAEVSDKDYKEWYLNYKDVDNYGYYDSRYYEPGKNRFEVGGIKKEKLITIFDGINGDFVIIEGTSKGAIVKTTSKEMGHDVIFVKGLEGDTGKRISSLTLLYEGDEEHETDYGRLTKELYTFSIVPTNGMIEMVKKRIRIRQKMSDEVKQSLPKDCFEPKGKNKQRFDKLAEQLDKKM